MILSIVKCAVTVAKIIFVRLSNFNFSGVAFYRPSGDLLGRLQPPTALSASAAGFFIFFASASKVASAAKTKKPCTNERLHFTRLEWCPGLDLQTIDIQ
jgi:hypothetical protein